MTLARRGWAPRFSPALAFPAARLPASAAAGPGPKPTVISAFADPADTPRFASPAAMTTALTTAFTRKNAAFTRRRSSGFTIACS